MLFILDYIMRFYIWSVLLCGTITNHFCKRNRSLTSSVGNAGVEKYPEKIKVSGLPFMLQGWNTTFVKCIDDGQVSYRLYGYTLYCFIPIIGVHITETNGKWHFTRECDFWPFMENCDLMGDWINHGQYIMTVKPA